MQMVEVQEERKKEWVLPLTEEMMFYHVPHDIEDFVEKVLPHMVRIVSKQQHSGNMPYNVTSGEIGNEFFVYMFSESRSNPGKRRWQLYSADREKDDRYESIPYVLWFLHNFKLFCFNAWRIFEKERNFVINVEIPIESERNGVAYDTGYIVECQELERKFVAFLERFSEKGMSLFEKNIGRLYDLLKNGEKGKVIAKVLGIDHTKTLTLWKRQLSYLIELYASNDSLGVEEALVTLKNYRRSSVVH